MGWMQRLKNGFARLMYGRNGPDQLGLAMIWTSLALDVLSFKLAANNRKVLEAAFPPERFTLPGHDAVKEYDEIERYEHGGAWHTALKEYLEEDLPQISLEEAKYRQSLGLNEWEPLPEN